MKLLLIVLFLSVVFVVYAQQASITLMSQEDKTTLIELYTSEGCSSCPRADQWLSGLSQKKNLWKEFIPVAFHVDYWNYLGWKDKLSHHDYTARQQRYKAKGVLQSVDTPAFVVNGQEWRNIYNFDTSSDHSDSRPGVMKVTVEKRKIRVFFESVTFPQT